MSHRERALEGLAAPARAGLEVAGAVAGTAFGALGRLRGGKPVHPTGAVYQATLWIAGSPLAPAGAPLLSTAGGHPAIVRFSRSLGLPRPLTDLLGVAIRIPDAHGPDRHQDFVVISSADGPILHRGFLPAGDFQARPYTSSLPYRAGDETFLVGLLPQPGAARPAGADELERLAHAAAGGELRFDFAVAPPFGRFQPIGELRIGRRLPDPYDALPFNPWNTGGGIVPAGFLNRLRAFAYPQSSP
jgi:hypothetical protein